MDFKTPFTFIWDDPQWIRKIMITGLVSLIPIFGWVYLFGWMLEIDRRVIRQQVPLLPELEFTDRLILGLKGTVVSLAYALPILILMIPVWLVTGIVPDNTQSSGTSAIVLVTFLCITGLVSVYALLVYTILPAAMSHLAVRGALKDGLNIKDVWGLVKADPGAYLSGLAGTFIAGLIAPLGAAVFGIGIVFTSAYSMAILAHFYGQAYREASQKRAQINLPGTLRPGRQTDPDGDSATNHREHPF
jgi:hypothetical protein